MHATCPAPLNLLDLITLIILGDENKFMGDMRNTYKLLVRKPEWKRLHIRPRLRWEDNNN